MIFNQILSHIFSSKSNVLVFRVLLNVAGGLSGREIARRSGLTPKTAHRVLSLLLDYNLVERQSGNTEHFYKLNNQNWLVTKIIRPSFEAENKFLKDVTDFIVNQTYEYCLQILLFGSVARKEENLSSDLDVCFIPKDVNLKDKLEDKILDITEKIKITYGANLSPIYLSIKEFEEAKKKVVKNIKKEGILLYKEKIIGKEKQQN